MDRRDAVVLGKIISEGELIQELLDGFNLDRFLADERTKRAVCMTLINIGELVKLLPADIRDAHTEVPWKLIAGLRDVTAHKYQTLRMDDIWLTCSQDMPVLLESAKKILLDGGVV